MAERKGGKISPETQAENDLVRLIMGRKIKERLKALNKSQDTLAAEVGLSQKEISTYATGKSDVPYRKLHAICYYLGITPNELVPNEFEMRRKDRGHERTLRLRH